MAKRLRPERVRKKYLLEVLNDSTASRKRRTWAYNELAELEKKKAHPAETVPDKEPSPSTAPVTASEPLAVRSGLAALAAELEGKEPEPTAPKNAPISPAPARRPLPDATEQRAAVERRLRHEDPEPAIREPLAPDPAKPEPIPPPIRASEPVRNPNAEPSPPAPRMDFAPLFPRHNRALVADPLSELEQARGRVQRLDAPRETEGERRQRIARDFDGMTDKEKRELFGY